MQRKKLEAQFGATHMLLTFLPDFYLPDTITILTTKCHYYVHHMLWLILLDYDTISYRKPFAIQILSENR